MRKNCLITSLTFQKSKVNDNTLLRNQRKSFYTAFSFLNREVDQIQATKKQNSVIYGSN